MIDSHYFSYCHWKKFILFLKKPIIKNLYRSIIPRKIREKFENFVDKEQQIYTAKHFQYFIKLYFENKLQHFNLTPTRKELIGKKIIWQYWAQGIKNCPPIVKTCFQSVDRFKGEYTIIRLDDRNIREYLDLPHLIFDKKNFNPAFKHAFFADLIRLALLDTYGGIWLDATVFLTDNIPNELLKMDYFMFQRSLNAPDKQKWTEYDPLYFNWHSDHKVNVLNSIIVAKRGNIVIHTLFDLLMNFWLTQENIPHYFFFQIMYNELVNDYFKEKSCNIIDDTIPHLLHYRLNNTFDKKEFELIAEKTSIHKLRYIKNVKNNSFYEYIIKNNIKQ